MKSRPFAPKLSHVSSEAGLPESVGSSGRTIAAEVPPSAPSCSPQRQAPPSCELRRRSGSLPAPVGLHRSTDALAYPAHYVLAHTA
jgi:hypothetical protein